MLIDWDGAGHLAVFPARALRLACACAECVEEMSGRRLLRPEAVAADIKPLRLQLVGGYGLRIEWSDGHSTGIYTFERLRRDCPCSRCTPPVR